MPQNFIKVFNDTVLKLSINQGIETQRTNETLGKFTSGELVYTRDTGRVFVGNYTTQNNEFDSNYVSGGILLGNKYLGLIDSKRLGYWHDSWIPLNYDSKSYFNEEDENKENDTTHKPEEALLLKDSKFRTDKNKGWNKKSHYIEKYDAYTGDFMFDIYQNAFVLFDKNITTVESEQPISVSVKSSDGTSITEAFVNEDGEIIDGVYYDNGLTDERAKRRTVIQDNLNSNNKNYPIYGDGYVIARILEPDGITLRYKQKEFGLDGKPLTDIQNGNKESLNYSHNYIEVGDVKTTSISGNFDEKQFKVINDKISLADYIENVKGFVLKDNSNFSLPGKITFSNNTANINFDFCIPSLLESSQSSNDFVLALKRSKTGNTFEYKAYVAKPSTQTYQINLGEGLYSPDSASNNLILSTGESPTLQLKSPELSRYINNDPFYIGESSSYNYSGNLAFNEAGMKALTEEYERNYLNNGAYDFAKKFDSYGNVSLNYLKNPIPICWSNNSSSSTQTTDSALLTYLIKPYLFCLTKDTINNSITVVGNNTVPTNGKKFNYIDGYSSIPGDEFPEALTSTAFIINTTEALTDFKSPDGLETNENNEQELFYVPFSPSAATNYNKFNLHVRGEKNFDIKNPNVDKLNDGTASVDDYTILLAFAVSNSEDEGWTTSNVNKDIKTSLKIDLNEIINKVSISSNNKDKKLRTIFTLTDFASKASEFTSKYSLYQISPEEKTCLIVEKEGIIYNVYCVTNMEFLNLKEYAPYYVSIDYKDSTTSSDIITKTYTLEKDIQYYNSITIYATKQNDIIYYTLDDEFNTLDGTPAIVAVYNGTTGTDAETFYTQNGGILPTENDTDTSITLIPQSINTNNIAFITYKNELEYIPLASVVKIKGTDNYATAKISVGYEENTYEITVALDGNGTTIVDRGDLPEDVLPEQLTYYTQTVSLDSTVYKPIIYRKKTALAYDDKYSIPSDGSSGSMVNSDGTLRQYHTVIPDHASSILLEFHHFVSASPNNSTISCYTSKNASVDNLSKSSAEYTFPYAIPSLDFDASNELSYPTYETSISGEDEKMIYSSSNSGVKIVEVPLYRSSFDNSKAFSLRLSNVIANDPNNKFLIRVIGYRA